MKTLYTLLALAVLVVGMQLSRADTKIGDDAPRLEVAEWVKGGPITLDKGKIYVLEFWATWCGPCRTSIPHLTKLQDAYEDQGVQIIGVSVDSERSVDQVKPFVEKWGDKMDYAVAIDGKAEKASKAYMEAFGVRGIPHAFVIDKDGKLIWHSHPNELDEVLKALVAGEFDLAAAKEKMAERERQAKQMQEAQKAAQEYFVLATRNTDTARLKALEDKIVKAIKDEAGALNWFSWQILTVEGLEHRNLDLALELARRGVELTESKDANIVDTLARAHYEKGDLKEAIKLQRKAVAIDGENEQLGETLEKYEAEAKVTGR